MESITQILQDISAGKEEIPARLIPLVYDELKRLAARRLKNENPANSLQATALVHEAFLRLVQSATGTDMAPGVMWTDRQHFFAAAAEAMRRIIVDAARRRNSIKRGGRVETNSFASDEVAMASPTSDEEAIAIHDVLDRFSQVDRQAAELVKLRFFAGLTMNQSAEVLGVSLRTAHDIWSYAKAWLRNALQS